MGFRSTDQHDKISKVDEKKVKVNFCHDEENSEIVDKANSVREMGEV